MNKFSHFDFLRYRSIIGRLASHEVISLTNRMYLTGNPTTKFQCISVLAEVLHQRGVPYCPPTK